MLMLLCGFTAPAIAIDVESMIHVSINSRVEQWLPLLVHNRQRMAQNKDIARHKGHKAKVNKNHPNG